MAVVTNKTEYSFVTQESVLQVLLEELRQANVVIEAAVYGHADYGYVFARMVAPPAALEVMRRAGVTPVVGVALQVGSTSNVSNALCLVALNAHSVVIDAVYAGTQGLYYSVQPTTTGRTALEQALSL